MVKTYRVVMSREAAADLAEIGDWLAGEAGTVVAAAYIHRLRAFIGGFRHAPLRGSIRDQMRSQMRVIGFELRAAIVIEVVDRRVNVLRILPRGRNWTREALEP